MRSSIRWRQMRFNHLKRRDFITLVAGATAAWPLAARAQQPGMPVIGYLSALSEAQAARQLAGFRRGLNEFGFVEGQNVAIEFRWADGQYDRLPGMAADLVRRPVTLILAQTPPAALAAKTATTIIPIVFVVGFDPVGGGLVASLGRPGGNITGLSLQQTDVAGKRLGLLLDLAPKSSIIAMLVNPISPNAAPEIEDGQAAAQAIGLQVKMYNASTPNELNAAFVAIGGQRPDALFVGSDPFFVNRREELVALAARLGIPAAYPQRDYVAAGGLISYGTNIASAYLQAGIYAGRILKGAKPADLPVMRPTTFELVINLKTAKALGLAVSNAMQQLADEVIE
jgi:putative tryptophan/tyrosine transport system substrate-binding protein